MWGPDDANAEMYRQWVRDAWERFRPFSTGGNYVNFQNQLQNPAKAIVEFRKVAEKWPKSHLADDALFNIGSIYLSTGEMPEEDRPKGTSVAYDPQTFLESDE